MNTADIMTANVELTSPSTPVQDAAKAMRADNVGALPVGENDRLVGMITDRDIALRVVAEGHDPASTSVGDAMSERITYCFDTDTLDRAAEIMAEHQIRRLPVLNADKRLVGMVALGDLARSSEAVARDALAGVSQVSSAARH